MANESLLQALFAQAWQLAALAIVVGLCVRYFARNRPHLAHALWLVVLLKCVTPPVWGSPIGVFSWLSPSSEQAEPQEANSASIEVSPNSVRTLTAVVDSAHPSTGAEISAGIDITNDVAASISVDVASVENEDAAQTEPSGWRIRLALAIWGAGVIATAIVSAIRFAACWRRLRRSEVETHPELESLVAELTTQLRLRRGARLLITASRVGPAVIGLWRPTILLPACVVRGRAAEELEPIVAHELIHVRRGDLWVGLLQTVAQALWWFHPLVWLANRMITREAERCCDEEVIGELRCDPSRYARSLLGVLEWKRILIPAPAVPGVRAVEITSRRLERIMTLGQGCRRRTPWWCWVAMLAVAALALPGSPLRIVATEPDEAKPTPQQGAPLVYAHPQANPAPEQAKPAPVEFPEDRDVTKIDFKKSGDTYTQWFDVDDLLKTIERQLGVNHALAKQHLWLLLVEAHRDPRVVPPMISDGADMVSPPKARPDLDAKRAYWVVKDNALVLESQPRERHERTAEALADLRKYGFESVDIEIHFLTSPLNVVTDVSSKWTTLPMMGTKEVEADLHTGFTPPAGKANTGIASFAVEKNLPVILDVLGDMRTKALIDAAQGERRANVLQAPRLRVPNGRSATVIDCSQTPFVVGFKNDKPQISIVSEGTTVRTRPVLDGDKIHLDFEVVMSGLREVEVFDVRGPDGVMTKVQSPEVAQSRVAASIDVPLGQTVLIGGLKNVIDPKSNTSMAVLLTVKKAAEKSAAKTTDDAPSIPDGKQEGESRGYSSTTKPAGPTYAILGPITSGSTTTPLDPPSQEAVLRAIEKAGPSDKAPRTLVQDHKKVRMTIEPISDYVDPPRVYPLIGPAQLHHAHYKCTINCGESKADQESRKVVYIDYTHFHMVKNVDSEDVTVAAPKEPAARDKKREESLFTVTYAVADLIIPFPNPVTWVAEKDAKPLDQAKPDFRPLEELIVSTVKPESWQENDGPCTIAKFPQNLSLVITQTEKGHEEIAALFKQLRARLDQQVVLDCRTVADPAEILQIMKSDGAKAKRAGVELLTQGAVDRAQRAAETKGGTNFKLTVFNGQGLKLPRQGQAQNGQPQSITIQPSVSPDGGQVRVYVFSEPEGTRQPWDNQALTVLECGSLLIDAAKFPMPVDGISPAPTKDGTPSKSTFVLITPRVIHADQAKPKDKKGSGAPSDGKRSGTSLPRKSVPRLFTDEDQRQVGAGVQVTKVLYRPNEEYAGYGLGPVETIVSTRLDPSVDPIAEARRRGSIVAVVRMDADLRP